MALARVKLNNGTTTVDLFGGAVYLADGGLDIGLPQAKPTYVGGQFSEGDSLSGWQHGNRTIRLRLHATGASLAGLKTNLRTIQRLLDDAATYQAGLPKQGLLTASGKLYLEIQWGDTDDQSTMFEIVRGELAMPPGGYDGAVLLTGYRMLNCELRLECKPYGLYAAQDIAQDTLENSQATYVEQDKHIDASANDNPVYGTNWEAQTFQATGNYTVTGIWVPLKKTGTGCGNITVAIFATAAGAPSGAALASGTYDSTLLVTTATIEPWVFVSFGAGVALANGTTYAVGLYQAAAGGDAGNHVDWLRATGAYAGGSRYWSNNSGAAWNADATQDYGFCLLSATTAANYKDITTSESYGDVPAGLYAKIDQTGATGSKNIWVARRSGHRQTDDLWHEAENCDSRTETIGYWMTEAEAGRSNAGVQQIYCVNVNGDTTLGRWNFSLATPPRGAYRVLVAVKSSPSGTNTVGQMGYGYGYSYGGKTRAPTNAAGQLFTCAVADTWEILDLGLLHIPPIAESDIAGNSAFELRIFAITLTGLSGGTVNYWRFDYLFLLPIDEGAVIMSSVAADDILALDAITNPANVFKIVSDNIDDYPDYIGAPFPLARESTRLYVVRNDVPAVTFAVDLKYQPRFVHI